MEATIIWLCGKQGIWNRQEAYEFEELTLDPLWLLDVIDSLRVPRPGPHFQKWVWQERKKVISQTKTNGSF